MLTHIRKLVSQDTYLLFRTKISVYLSSKPDIRIFPMIVPQHVQEAMISEDGLFIQMVVLASWMVKLSLDGV